MSKKYKVKAIFSILIEKTFEDDGINDLNDQAREVVEEKLSNNIIGSIDNFDLEYIKFSKSNI